MAFRFFRRIRIAPGITLNLSKSGLSVSGGPRGAKFTVGPRGTRRTIGLPGTGFYYTEHTSSKRRRASRSRNRATEAPASDPQDRLTLGFFKRLVTPKDEQDLVAGLAALVQGDERKALDCLERANHLTDAAFLSGILQLKKGLPHEALTRLRFAAQRKARLGSYLTKYGVEARFRISVTPQVKVEIRPDRRGLVLALVEAYQELDRLEEAIPYLKQLQQSAPDDPVVTLSLIELLMEARSGDRRMAKKVIELAANIENDSEVHGAILLFRAKALGVLGMNSAARTVLSKTLRKTKNRSKELLRSLRYERALAYERLGQKARARKDLALIYADEPKYEDVARRLGIA